MERALTDADYVRANLFPGEESEITLRSVKLVTARKEHDCFLGRMPGATPHAIQIGEEHRHERAMIDGEFFGSYRACLPCIRKHLLGEVSQ